MVDKIILELPADTVGGDIVVSTETREAAEAARDAAQAAASVASTASTTATTKATEAFNSAAAAEAAKLAAQAVPTTNDTVMAAVAADTGSAFSTQLSATIGAAVDTKSTVRVGGVPVSTFDVENTPLTKVDIGLENVDNTADINKLTSEPVRAVLGYRNVTGETMPRFAATNLTGITLQNGTVRAAFFTALKTETVTQIGLSTGSTGAGATPSTIKFGLYRVESNGDLTRIGVTANDTALLSGASTSYAKSFAGGNAEIFAGQRYAILALILTGATQPTIVGVLGLNGTDMAQNPRLSATVLAQTDLLSSYTAGSLTNSGAMIYAWTAP
ncbi:MAG: hypothetical protein WC829_03410 [Hyphomicrobium sp.]|jgi:hypothetical protein